jgi:preprotein translocase subunit SecF
MGIVVFIYFRVPVPSIAVILSAFSDIVVTLAVVNVMGIKLSTAGIAAFLMLIGYSVDTDILLSTRVLKRKEGDVLDRVFKAMKTGLTMSITTLVAVTVALIFTQSIVLKQIMTILIIGLLIDLINTWIQNAGILRWYMERKGRKHGEN